MIAFPGKIFRQMSKLLPQIIFITLTFFLISVTYGQTKDTTNWAILLQHSNFIEINSIRKIDKTILTKFPYLKKISRPNGRFNATDNGEGHKLRLFFIANTANYWIISYEHGGLGYHTHCLLMTINSEKDLDIQESYTMFKSLSDLREAFANNGDALFRQWSGHED